MALPVPVRILIVDDEPDIAIILKLHLEDSGYVTSWAGDGDTALKMLSEEDYDLALMDIRMPGLSGVQLLEKMQKTGMSTTAIMMTAHGSEELAVECMKSGAVDYFTKPFSLDNILLRIERVISSRMTLQNKHKLEKEKEDFFLMLSHDLKNPITAVIGSIDIVREARLGPVNPEQEEYLQSAIDSCSEVVTMIDNLLDLQRFEAGKLPFSIRPHNLADIVETSVKRFVRAAEHDKIRLLTDLAENLPKVSVDRNALGRVITNLLANAVKFAPEEGFISIACHTVAKGSTSLSDLIPAYVRIPENINNNDGFVRISVKDNGCGIPAEDLGRIFERYTQSRNSIDREKGGAGLGLAYCRMTLESFNGIIWAESENGNGSEFIMLLPCSPQQSGCSSMAGKEVCP